MSINLSERIKIKVRPIHHIKISLFNQTVLGRESMKKIELLAPAGNFEALVAAVESGADAVYLGGSKFNARVFADNFTDEELLRAVEYAHIRGVKVYAVVNILIWIKNSLKRLSMFNFCTISV